ncbi:putative RNA-directed DNA polymerase from transposon BS [Trichonephila clavipes]|uniref:Putative RNA-directed DNA polymerase from transposon BS n=1 Tax=Trichonephila clavipes TaxID=2585209 RepID=A0A8X6RZY4_TRICX|nr:putative RNA-directed DNA polymerase from transposon BS [Trichonephila clavipes]
MSWKTAVVIPILKPDKNSALAESYRPISLLPVLSKLAEKVILARLNDHLERENILIPEQHGFRPRLSTSHQLLRVVEFIKEGNNKDECTAAVFLDIQKAFDRVLTTIPELVTLFHLASRHGDTLPNRRAASPVVRLVEGRPLVTLRVFYLKIGKEPSQIFLSPEWCSNLRLTTGVKTSSLPQWISWASI